MSLFFFLLVLLASFIHASWNLCAKHIGHNKSILWLGMGVGILMMFPFLWVIPANSLSMQHTLLMALPSGCIHAVYIGLLSYCYAKWDISSIYPIARGSAVGLASIWSVFFLQQSGSLIGYLGISATIIGILIIGIDLKNMVSSANQHPRHHLIGLGLALIIGTMISAYVTVDAFMAAQIHPLRYLLYCNILLVLILSPIMCYRYMAHIKEALRLYKTQLLYIGFASTVAYLLILYAFTKGIASYIVALREFSIVFVLIISGLLFKEAISKKKRLGILIIVAGTLLIKMA